MSDTQWFCVINGRQEGPYAVATLAGMTAQAPLAADTMVWTEGMAGWKPLSETPLYEALPKSSLPPRVPLSTVFQAGAQNMASQMSATINAPIANTQSPGFVDAVKICFRKYVDFNGRASRPEYWWFFLFGLALSIITMMFPLINMLISLVLILPSIAVGVRRLHDIDRTGWWLLIGLIPLVGFIVLIIFLTKQGTAGQNRFG